MNNILKMLSFIFLVFFVTSVAKSEIYDDFSGNIVDEQLWSVENNNVGYYLNNGVISIVGSGESSLKLSSKGILKGDFDLTIRFTNYSKTTGSKFLIYVNNNQGAFSKNLGVELDSQRTYDHSYTCSIWFPNLIQSIPCMISKTKCGESSYSSGYLRINKTGNMGFIYFKEQENDEWTLLVSNVSPIKDFGIIVLEVRGFDGTEQFNLSIDEVSYTGEIDFSGVITGIVGTDIAGHTNKISGINEAQILIKELDKTVLSDSEGEYLFLDIPPGNYTLEIKHNNFTPLVLNDVLIERGSIKHLEYNILPLIIGDINNDSKISLVEAINALQIVSGVKTQ